MNNEGAQTASRRRILNRDTSPFRCRTAADIPWRLRGTGSRLGTNSGTIGFERVARDGGSGTIEQVSDGAALRLIRLERDRRHVCAPQRGDRRGVWTTTHSDKTDDS